MTVIRLLGLPGDTHVFRESTVRPNIQYQVQKLTNRSLSSRDIADYLHSEQKVYGKILVYTETTVQAEELAAIMGCYIFHGQMTEGEQRRNLQSFEEAKDAIILATSAFSVGVDISDIRAVFRLGKVPHLIQWLQEAGRGGRDGLPAVARMLVAQWMPNIFYNKADNKDKARVDAFIQEHTLESQCRRILIDGYMDGDYSRTLCALEEEKCDICQKRFYSSSTSGFVETNEVYSTPLQPPSDAPNTPAPKHRAYIEAASTHADTPSMMSSSPAYELSSKKHRVGSTSQSFEASPSRLVLSPKKHHRLSLDTSYSLPSASPQKRTRATGRSHSNIKLSTVNVI